MRYKKYKNILLIICLFVGIGALFGSICMFIDPSGNILDMNNLLPYFKVLPFSDILFTNYIFSGISLLIVNGITNLTASYLIIKDKKIGFILGTIFGITLMLWIMIQFIILPFNKLSTTFFIIGLLQFIIGYITNVIYIQEHFKVDINKYKNINKDSDTLVVYFSRLGYTKKVAYSKANELNANIIELTTNENIKNTIGFLWCGRYGMHKWRMKINDINIDLKKYKTIIIVTPIWVFDMSSPVRDFIYKYKKDINNVEYIFTHFMKCDFISKADNIDKILNIKRNKLTSICIRFGKIIYEKEINRKDNYGSKS